MALSKSISELKNDPEFISFMKDVRLKRNDIVLGRVPQVMDNYNGVTMALTFRPEIVKYVNENWTPRKNDVFLFSYMKTGNHWTQRALEHLMYNKEELNFIKNCYSNFFVYECLPEEKVLWWDKLKFQRIFYGHQPEFNIPVKKFTDLGAKIVYVYRNPKDAAVSAFYFRNKNFPPEQRCKNWDEFVELYFKNMKNMFTRPGECILDHIRQWYTHIDNKNVMFLCYEEMHRNMPLQLRRISNFIGVQKTDSELIEIAQKLQFDVEKKEEEQLQYRRESYLLKLGMKRKGVVGDWRNHFTEEQSIKVDKLVEEKLKGTNIKFIYDLPTKSNL